MPYPIPEYSIDIREPELKFADLLLSFLVSMMLIFNIVEVGEEGGPCVTVFDIPGERRTHDQKQLTVHGQLLHVAGDSGEFLVAVRVGGLG